MREHVQWHVWMLWLLVAPPPAQLIGSASSGYVECIQVRDDHDWLSVHQMQGNNMVFGIGDDVKLLLGPWSHPDFEDGVDMLHQLGLVEDLLTGYLHVGIREVPQVTQQHSEETDDGMDIFLHAAIMHVPVEGHVGDPSAKEKKMRKCSSSAVDDHGRATKAQSSSVGFLSHLAHLFQFVSTIGGYLHCVKLYPQFLEQLVYQCFFPQVFPLSGFHINLPKLVHHPSTLWFDVLCPAGQLVLWGRHLLMLCPMMFPDALQCHVYQSTVVTCQGIKLCQTMYLGSGSSDGQKGGWQESKVFVHQVYSSSSGSNAFFTQLTDQEMKLCIDHQDTHVGSLTWGGEGAFVVISIGTAVALAAWTEDCPPACLYVKDTCLFFWTKPSGLECFHVLVQGIHGGKSNLLGTLVVPHSLQEQGMMDDGG
ncbi:hypothetical protein F5141DRAFT_1066810 [Pisolithus sp. B1]|nr:hypothetical protein F5141DRAFT_1066810 [Pisolithus sp. B1]